MTDWWAWGLYLVFAILSVSLVLTLVRLIRGPSLADRAVVLDLVVYQIVAFTALYTIVSGHTGYLDVALGLGLISFLGTIAFARYLERSEHREHEGGKYT